MRTRTFLIFLLFLVSDFIAIFLSLILSALYSISPYVIHHSHYTLTNLDLQYIYLLLCLVWYFSARSTGIYDDPRFKLFSVDAYNILKNLIFQVLCLILLLFLIKERALTRTFVIVYFMLAAVFIFLGKILVRLFLKRLKHRLRDICNVVIVGANTLGRDVSKKLDGSSTGYNVLGYLQDEEESADRTILGKIQDLEKVLAVHQIDLVIVALSKSKLDQIDWIIKVCQDCIVELKIIPDVASYYMRDFKYSYLGDIPVVSVGVDRLSEPYWRIVKRCIDLSITLFLILTLFSWFFPLIFVLQKLLNPGPVFFKSERWGKGGKPFLIYKIRTMRTATTTQPDAMRQIPTDRNDHRVTKFGKLLRKSSLDELPQFYNVLKGEMSIVGPRPFESKEALLMKQILDNYMIRYHARPGITGWAQINGYRGGTQDLLLMQKRIDVDNWYMHNWTFGLDVQIMFFTVVQFIKGDINAY